MIRSLLTLSCLAALSGCAVVVFPDGETQTYSVLGSPTEGDGQIRTEVREFAGAPKLVVNGAISVIEETGPTPSISVEADSNLIGKVLTEARGDTLRISVDGPYRSNNGIRVHVITPQLSNVVMNGSGKVNVIGLSGGNLAATMAGSGRIQLNGAVEMLDAQIHGSGRIEAMALRASRAQLEVSGSGAVELGQMSGETLSAVVHGSGAVHGGGQVNSLSAKVNGSGSINMSALTAQEAELTTNGSGEISATVRRAVKAAANGSGHVNVYGGPVERSVSGKNVHING